MDLEELEKRLYKEGAKFEKRPQSPTGYSPGGQDEEKIATEQWPEAPVAKKSFFDFLNNKKFRLYSLIALAGIFLIAVGFFIWGQFSFSKNDFQIEIYAPQKAISGETISYLVQYKNNNNVNLENVKFQFYFPEGSIIKDKEEGRAFLERDLKTIFSGQAGEEEFRVQITGVKNEIKKAKVVVSFNPSSISSTYETQVEQETEIIAVPLILNLNLPEKSVSGQKINFNLQYLNDSDILFEDLKILVKYPSGFIFEEAIPEPVEEKIIWRFDEFAAQESGEIKISGVLSGDGGEVKSFEAILGVEQDGNFIELDRTLRSTQIDQAPLSIWQKINQEENYTANWGDSLSFEIFYKNTSRENIRGVTVSAKLDPKAIDLTTLNIPQGSFDGRTNTIYWTNVGVADLGFLQEGQEGSLKFFVQVRNDAPINSFLDKNFVISVRSKIDSPNIPLSLVGTQIGSEDVLEIPLNSLLKLDALGYFNDDTFSNTGPIPPRVGQETTYTLYWNVTNASNDVKDVTVQAFLPENVEWTGNISPAGQDLSFDRSTRKITWKLGSLNPGVGYVLPAKQVAFQVALTPSIVQVNQSANLLRESKIYAKDNFTGQSLENSDELITTELPDDPSLPYNGGTISQ